MTLYDTYRTKVEKIGKVKNKIHKLRYLIVGVSAVILLAVAGCLASIGWISKNVTLTSNHFVYGEPIVFEDANVLIGSASYEYSTKGSNIWTSDTPTLPGEYYMRAKTKRVFGITSYSNPVAFAIGTKPIDLKVQDDQIVYGNDPSICDIDLVEGDKVCDVSFEYEDLSLDTTNVKVKSILIQNEQGEDVTDFYQLNKQSTPIAILKRDIVLTPVVSNLIYTGEPISKKFELTDESLNQLVENDEISFSVQFLDSESNGLSSSPVNCGNYQCKIAADTIQILNGSSDRTSHYNITINSVQFSILKYDITLTTPDATKEYDGTPLSKTVGYGISDHSSLLSTHSLVVDPNQVTAITNVSQVVNVLNIIIVDEEGNDVSQNYNIHYEYGTLSITKRIIEVTPLPIDDKIYDGISVTYGTNYQELSKEMPDGELLKIAVVFKNSQGMLSDSIVHADSYEMVLDSYTIVNGRKENYDISLITETTKISPRKLYLKPINFENKTYDGVAYEYSTEYQNYEYVASAAEENKVVAGEEISVLVDITCRTYGYTEAKHAGTYTIMIHDFNVNLATTIKSDYVLGVCETVGFIISPRVLQLKPIQFEDKVYDGASYEYPKEYQNYDYQETALEENKVVAGEEISVWIDITSDTYGYTEAKHADRYVISINDFSVNEATTIRSDYVLGACEIIDFTIGVRPMSIIPNYCEVIYNKTIFEYGTGDNNFTYYGSSLQIVDGDIVTISVDTYLNDEIVNAIHADTYELRINHIEYKNAYETDYAITTYDSTLWISPRALQLKPINFEDKIYDGVAYEYSTEYQNYEYLESATEENKVVAGEEISVLVDITGNLYGYTGATHADTYTISIYDFNVNDATTIKSDYVLGIRETVSFTISSRVLQLKPIQFEDKVYDGASYKYPKEYQNYEYVASAAEENKVVAGEEISVWIDITSDTYGYTEAKHADTYTITIRDFEVNNATTIKTDYVLETCETVEFTISPRTLLLKPIAFENKIYDGTRYEYSTEYQNYDYLDTALEENKVVAGEEINVFVDIIGNDYGYTEATHVDNYTISIEGFNVNDTTTIKSDYVLGVCETVGFTISPRTLLLKPNAFENKIYDGITYEYSLEYQNYDYQDTALEENKVVAEEQVKISVDIIGNTYGYTEATHADTYTISITDFEVNEVNTIKTDYVLGICEAIDFTISPRTLLLKPNAFENKIYDGITYDYSTEYQNYEYQETALEENKVVAEEQVKVSVDIISDVYGYSEAKHADTYTISIIGFEVDETTTIKTDYVLGACESVDFTIAARPMAIMPNYCEVIYNKTIFEYGTGDNNFTYYGSSLQIVDGDIITISVDTYLNDEIVNAIHADTYELRINNIEYKNAYETDYAITTYDSTLWISPRALQLKPINFEDKIYDGVAYEYSTEYQNYEYLDTAVAENTVMAGEQVKVLVDVIGNTYGYTEIKHADTYTISIVDFEVNNTSTMKTDYVLGPCETVEFTISPRLLKIKPTHFENKIYDGVAYEYSTEYQNYEYLDTAVAENTVVAGEEIKVLVDIIGNNYGYTEIKHADTYTISIVDFEVNNATTMKTDYVLGTCETLDFTISPRTLMMRPIQLEDKIYDGVAYEYSTEYQNYEYIETVAEENRVLTGETISILVGYIGNTYGYTEAKHADTYIISITDFEVDSTTTLKTDYELGACETQSFTISPRTLKLKPINFEDKIYDGVVYEYSTEYQNYEYLESSTEENKVVDGEEISVLVDYFGNNYGYAEAKHADTYTMSITDFNVNETTTIKSDYVLGTCETVSFTIDVRTMSIMPKSSKSIYDKTAYKYGIGNNNFAYYNATSLQIVDGDIITISVDTYLNGEIVEAIHANTYDLKIHHIEYRNAYETDYDITTFDNELQIIPRKLRLNPIHFEDKIYDGIAYEYPTGYQNYEYPYGTIERFKVVDGEEIRVLVNITGNTYGYTEAKHADTYTISIIDFEVDSTTTLKTDYELGACETQSFTISPRTLKLKPFNFENKVYDGNSYEYSTKYQNYEYLDIATEENHVLAGEQVKVLVDIIGNTYGYTETKHADTYTISIRDFEVNHANTIQTDYVLGSCETVDFTISPRTLKLRPFNFDDKVYDGNSYEYSTGYKNYEYLESVSNENKVLTGEEISVLVNFIGNTYGYTEAKHADTYTITIADFNVNHTNTIKTDYVLGTCENQAFTISPTHLNIKLIPFTECVYNGNPHLYLDEYNNFITEDPIYNDDTIKIKVRYFDDLGNKVTPIEVGRYCIQYDSHECSPGQSSDYLITQIEEYYFEIVEKTIHITTQDVENKIYDGLTVSYDVTENNFVEVSKNFDSPTPALTIKVGFINMETNEETTEISHTGEYAVAIKEVIFLNEEDADKYLVVYPTNIEDMKHIKIEKRTISIKPNTISQCYDGMNYTYPVYAENYDYAADSEYQMVQGQQLMIEASVLEGNVKDQGVYTLQITNVQACESTLLEDYNIITEQTSSLTILKRDVTIIPATPKDAGKEYDGVAITYDTSYGNYTYPIDTNEENQFVPGEEIVITVDTYYNGILTNEIKNAGNYTLCISSHLDENSVLDNYNLNYGDDVSFTIEKAKVTISPSIEHVSGTGFYDGIIKTYLIEEGNYVASVTIPNEYFTITPTIYQAGVVSDILHTGEYQLSITESSIVPSAGVSLNNYELSFVDAEYQLSPRRIEIALLPVDNATYSGVSYSYSNEYNNYYMKTSENDVLEIDGRMKVKATINGESVIRLNAGNYSVAFADYELEYGLKSDYEIICNTNVEFTIYKKDISITLLSLDSTIYNGLEQNNYPRYYGNYQNVDGLIDGEELMVVVSYSDTPQDAFTYNYGIDSNASQVQNDQYIFDLSMNYNVVSCEEKQFVIQPASVHIDLNQMNLIFNKTSFDGKIDYQITEGILYNSDSFEIIATSYCKNNPNGEVVTEAIFVGTYYYKDTNIQFIEGKLQNYTITIDRSSFLEITPLELEIVLDSVKEAYNSLTHSLSLSEIETGFMDGDGLQAITYQYYDSSHQEVVPKDVGIYEVVIDQYEFFGSNGSSLENYHLTFKNGQLEIIPAIVNFEIEQIEDKIYDDEIIEYSTAYGNYLSCDWEFTDIQFALDISFKYLDFNNVQYETKQAVDAYTYQIVLRLKDVENDKVSNFDCRLSPTCKAEFVIQKRSITISTGSNESDIIYDGLSHSEVNHITLADSSLFQLVPGHEISYINTIFNPVFSVVDAGIHSNKIDCIILKGEQDISYNYDINYVYGTITILPRPISLQSEGMVQTYNGYDVINNNYSILEGSLVAYSSDEISIKHSIIASRNYEIYGKYINVGIYQNVLDYQIVDEISGENVTKNYSITATYQNIEIKSQELLVTYSDVIQTYIPGVIFSLSIEFQNLSLADSLEMVLYIQDSNNQILYDEYGNYCTSVKDVGNYLVTIENLIINGVNYEDQNNYTFDFSKNQSPLIINKSEDLIFDVYTKSHTFTLNGRKQSYPYIENPLLPNENYSYGIDDSSITYIQYEASKENKLAVIIYYKGQDITKNTTIIYHYGTLNMDNEVFVHSPEKMKYDGSSISTTYYETSVISMLTDTMVQGITAKITYSLVQDGVDVIGHDAGIYNLNILEYQIYVDDTKEDITDKLVLVRTEELQLEIMRRKMFIRPIYKDGVIYDGSILEYQPDEFEYFSYVDYYSTNMDEIESDTFAENDNYKLKITASDYLSAPGKVKPYISNIQLIDENENVLAPISENGGSAIYTNYEIIYHHEEDKIKNKKQFYGFLQILERTIEITTYGGSKTYDGQPLYVNKYDYHADMYDGLLPGDTLVLRENSFSVTKVTTPKLNKLKFDIQHADGTIESANKYYNIVYTAGEESFLTILPKHIVIETQSLTVNWNDSYSTSPLTCQELVNSVDLVEGDTLDMVWTGSISIVGSTENTVDEGSVVIKNALGSNVTENYEIEFKYGTLEIKSGS